MEKDNFMKVVQVSTYDIQGGAARSAYRLHRGLLQLGEDCRMLVRHKVSTDDSVFGVEPMNLAEEFDRQVFLSTVIQGYYINSQRTDISNTLFSLPYPGYDLSALPLVQAADLLNLHWVAYYQSPISLRRLVNLGKPMVWTLHDQWPFTGGCHVASGCDRYREDCRACPQLADDPFDLPEAVLADKLELLRQADLTIVTPSRWLATCATESRLFKDAPVLVIPNSVETDVFAPLPKAQAREALALPLESVVLLFGATDVREKLKGFRELQGALQHCLAHPEFQRLVDDDKIRLLCFGQGSEELRPGRIPTTPLGYVASEETMRSAYAAADVFILPSLEDNLPNTMLEAMSCGLPVVAFDAGGIPEVIVDGVTGRLAPVGDVRGLGEAILPLIFDPGRREAMGKESRRAMVDGYTLERQALRYRELYQNLLDQQQQPRALGGGAVAELSPQSKVSEAQAADALPVLLETGLGLRFQLIYEAVLSRALREFALAREKAYQESEADRHARLQQINRLTELLQESESDRAARLENINRLTELLEESEADRTARLENINRLTELLQESEADRAARLEQIDLLTRLLQESEADRAARLEVIRNQECRIRQLEDELRLLESRVEVRLRRRLSQLLKG